MIVPFVTRSANVWFRAALFAAILVSGASCGNKSEEKPLTSNATVPAPPVNVAATPQNGKALVRWDPPPHNGGQPITGYTVLTSPSGLAVSVDGAQRSATVIGLTNGVLYSFAVVASNVVGSSSPSLYSEPVRPAQPPSVPLDVSATDGIASATVRWRAPASDGGGAITNYRVVSEPGNVIVTAAASATSAQLTGLLHGTAYRFKVVAINWAGGSDEAVSASITTPNVPGIPYGFSATRGQRSLTVRWSAPENNGRAITSYDVTIRPPNQTLTVSGPEATFSNLPADVYYWFTASALNAVGRGGVGTSQSFQPGRMSPRFANVSFPSSTAGGCIRIPYDLVHPDSSRASLRIQYSDEINPDYRDATPSVTSPDEIIDLQTSPGGTPHAFVWRSSSDLQVLRERVKLRLTVWETGHAGGDTPVSIESSPFAVTNRVAFSRSPNVYTVGTNPSGVVAADFNGDGKVDLVVSNRGSNTVSFFAGTGTGSFSSAVNSPVDSLPTAIAAADFDQDGYLDIVTLHVSTGSVSIAFGNGNGTFANRATYSVGFSPSTLVVGDFNGDQFPDLVVDGGSNRVNVLLNSGDGTMAPPVSYAIPSAVRGIVAAEFRTGLAADLIVTTSTALYRLQGEGDGSFGAAVLLPGSAGANTISLKAADLNNDGKMDLIQQYSTSVEVRFGNGDGSFQSVRATATGASSTSALAIGDLDGDGKPDLIIPNSGTPYTAKFMLGRGDGYFSAVSYPSSALTSFLEQLAAADFDNDGKVDFAGINLSTNRLETRLNIRSPACDG